MPVNTINKGNQLLTFDYQNEASSLSFNKLFRHVVPKGVYQGGSLSIAGANSVSVSPGTFVVDSNNADWTNQVSVRVETKDAYAVTGVTTGAPYVVVRLEWGNVVENYADLLAVTTPLITDVILGKATFTGSAVTGFDLSERENAYRESNTQRLGAGINRAPTGGSTTSFASTAFVYDVLVDLYNKIESLAGTASASVKRRHVDFGTGATQTNGSVLPVGAAVPVGNGGADSPATDSLATVVQRLAALVKNLSGVDNSAVTSRLVNFGVGGAGKISGSEIPAGADVTFGGSAGLSASTDSIMTLLAKIVASLKNASGIDASAILKTHISFGTGATQVKGLDIPVGSDITRTFTHLGGNVTLGESLSLRGALNSLMSVLALADAEFESARDRLDAAESALASHSSAISARDVLPIGTILMWDGPSWTDDTTIPGWFACTEANHLVDGNIPNLEGLFLKGGKPGAKGTAYGAFAGTQDKTIAAGNLPLHTHDMDHRHVITLAEAGSHRHRVDNVDDASGNGADTSRWSTYAGDHTHVATETGPRLPANTTVDKTSTGNGGFANTPLAIDTRSYSVIFIRKCS